MAKTRQKEAVMARKPILDLHIEANGPAVHMQGENAEVLMVPFKGSAQSEILRIFAGKGGWGGLPEFKTGTVCLPARAGV